MKKAPMQIAQGTNIVQLTDDILEAIFEYNGNPFRYEAALKDLRTYSQVSQNWRRIVLSASRLWGRVIDLDALKDAKDSQWIDEILRRAGTTSSLWIKGTYGPYETSRWIKGRDGVNRLRDREEPHFFPRYFFSFLTSQWVRVERFVVIVNARHRDDAVRPEWDVIYHLPSPRLRQFSLKAPQTIRSTVDYPIFSNHAPLLTSFSGHNLVLDLKSMAWLTQLQALILDCYIPFRDAISLLNLALMLRLKEFYVSFRSPQTGRVPHFPSCIRVDSMSDHLVIKSDVKGCINLLTHSNFSSQYFLDIMATTGQDDVTGEEVLGAWSQLSAIYKLEERSVQLSVTLEKNRDQGSLLRYFENKVTIDVSFNSCKLLSITIFEIPSSGFNMPTSLLECLPAQFAVDDFRLRSFDHIHGNHEDCQDCRSSSIATLKWLLRTSSSASSLSTDADGIGHILRLQTAMASGDILLPSLEVVSLLRGSMIKVVPFLHLRRQLGYPIKALDLTNRTFDRWMEELSSGPYFPKHELRHLEKFAGLKVRCYLRPGGAIEEHVIGE